MSGSRLIQKETDNLYSLPISELENHNFMPELFDRNQLIYDFPGIFNISSPAWLKYCSLHFLLYNCNKCGTRISQNEIWNSPYFFQD
jgi:hypothetical protein